MSDKSVRIRTTPNGNDKYLKMKLDQEFDFIEVLSLKITQEQAYRTFCSDYGVVVGRVIINSGFGVPNARVSIFIPIDDVDKMDPQIKGLYPYELITDKDSDGKRFNILPKYNESNNECFTPIGTFPTKREVLDDPDMNYIYCKYYKFTTTTNDAGDFMIFGVPLGNYTLHVDLDISDMGIASQRPYDSISQGGATQLFDSPTKFKSGTNLDKLAQVKSANMGVNVQPFWGDTNNCEVGITRVDVDMNYTITPSAIFIGGIFGDQNKDNVDKNCQGRPEVGNVCNQVISEGTIEMIRKTVNGDIEKIDINGGRLINDKGSWSYQVPMNLDYVVTDEFGMLVPSEDPNKGIPTRANVRFRISMDETGDSARLVTRAKHLVPHNPKTPSEIDYEFGQLTKDSSFKDLFWNKIYTVSSFIPRYQRSRTTTGSDVKNRNMLAIKDVDACPGDKNPIPFNRVNTQFNVLFFIICLIMKIIEAIIALINVAVIPILNLLISYWNKLILGIAGICVPVVDYCPFGFLENLTIDYIPCISVQCPQDSPNTFAPWCFDSIFPISLGYNAAGGSSVITSFHIGELSDCIAAEMARSMNLFKFDFYNDWLNGSLYSYLLRYKKFKNSEIYCDNDCATTNSCNQGILLDTCFDTADGEKKANINDGLIKKLNNEYYYAASTKDARYKLFATEIVSLGSVFNCDWQGVPKIQQFLKPTTFNSYPIIDNRNPDNIGQLILSGQVDIGGDFGGVFFSIGCLGLDVNSTQCMNIKKSCELGVDLDQLDYDVFGNIHHSPDHVIGNDEINEIYGNYVRDMFYAINYTNNYNFSTPFDTRFNITNVGDYPLESTTNNGVDYVNFRGITNGTAFQQPTHSYYFYFGAIPGKTGLDYMNNQFFTTCFNKLKNQFLIKINSFTNTSTISSSDGSVNFSIISGQGPFTYTVSGPNGYTATGSNNGSTPIILNSLNSGNYTINVIDANQVSISQIFTVPGPPPLYVDANVTHNVTGTTNNGQITIASISGGQGGPFTATLYHHDGSVAVGPITVTTMPYQFNNLPSDYASNGLTGTSEYFGYYLIVTDSGNNSYTVHDLTVTGPIPLKYTVTKTDINCYGDNLGGLKITVTGGTSPYMFSSVKTDGPSNPNNQTSNNAIGAVNNNLYGGHWTTTITDASNPPQTTNITTNIEYINPEMVIQLHDTAIELAKQCDPTYYTINVDSIGTNPQGSTYGGLTYNQIIASSGNIGYIQWAADSNIQPNGSGWSTPIPTTATYINGSSTPTLQAQIPAFIGNAPTALNSIGIRLCNQQGTCHSKHITIPISQMRLAPNLVLDTNSIDNTLQCSPNQVTFKFNISHLLLGITYRAPYKLYYKIKAYNSNGGIIQNYSTNYILYGTLSPSTPATITPTYINSNQQPISLILPFGTTKCDIQFYLEDTVGCQSTIMNTTNTNQMMPIMTPLVITGLVIPTSQLNTYYTHTTIGNNTTWTLHVSSGSGIPPYTNLVGPTIGLPTIYPNGVNFPSTVKDSVGCTVTIPNV